MEPEERRMNFLPQKYPSLRLVPAYKRFINERFERCLDLYLCPRKPKIRVIYHGRNLFTEIKNKIGWLISVIVSSFFNVKFLTFSLFNVFR